MNEDNQSNIDRTECNKNIEKVTEEELFTVTVGEPPKSYISTSDPCEVIGGNTIRLTEPDVWLECEKKGVKYVFPAYIAKD